LKNSRTYCPDAFPFKVVRAVDNSNNELRGIKISFNEKTKSFTFLNPRIIIAYRNKEDIIKIKETFITFTS
jgi:hypothetical protein